MTLSNWRSRLGAIRLEILLQQTVVVARYKNLLRDKYLKEVNVDTTVQPKAIAFPTGSRLYFKMTRALVRTTRNSGNAQRSCTQFWVG